MTRKDVIFRLSSPAPSPPVSPYRGLKERYPRNSRYTVSRRYSRDIIRDSLTQLGTKLIKK